MKQITFDLDDVITYAVLTNSGIEMEQLEKAAETIKEHKEAEAAGWRETLDITG